ncbi:MAG: hypothetical protein H0U76_04015 [Ktedonobacteraceae bacterium]|nr:hypothetical protein [Ktedonobacteraceae bacterium]
MFYLDEELDDVEAEPRELPTVIVAHGPCVTCGAPGRDHSCFQCGKPVCHAENYLADTNCGGWILDSWHPDASEENEYWCVACMEEGARHDLAQPAPADSADWLDVDDGTPLY